MTVAMVERKLVGGTCVNTGCTPTKTLVASAQAAYAARRAADYGVVVEGTVRVDMAKVKARADAVAANSRAGLEGWLRSMKGCTAHRGPCPLRGAGPLPRGSRPPDRSPHLHQRGRPPVRASPAGRSTTYPS